MSAGIPNGIRVLPVFTCAGCGGKFRESHTCPTGHSTTSSPGPIFIPIQQQMGGTLSSSVTFSCQRCGKGEAMAGIMWCHKCAIQISRPGPEQTSPISIRNIGTHALIEELWQRGDLELALREFKRRSAARAERRIPSGDGVPQ